ncbi:MAG: TonB-dependent receptor [Bacteroidetes bacterium]|nr:TonB-dependent receptor [Bacteroidota bacterium]
MGRRLLTVLIANALPVLSILAQTVISGQVTDQNNDPLVGVNLKIRDKLIGTTTDPSGNYYLRTESSPPFTLIITSVGFSGQEIEITNPQSEINIQLDESVILGQEVVISASRFEESILESPVSIEKLDILDMRQTPARDFYESIAHLKGVDIHKMSFTFKTINTRGFNGNTNFRVNQIIDGVDNAVPGLSFAAGNIFGIPPLDVESVELLVGASSALYGAGGVNGTVLMQSKNPFDYQGLSFSTQTGLMHVGANYRSSTAPMGDFSLRYAKAYNDKFAFKVNVNYVRAIDWNANDKRDRANPDDPNSTRLTNPGYDGVNVYGDEVGINLKDFAPNVATGIANAIGLTPGSQAYIDTVNYIVGAFPNQNVTRTGFDEKYLVDYDTKNLLGNLSLNYRINEELELSGQVGIGTGTSVYTAQNRFSLVNFSAINGKIELKSPNYFIRVWSIQEKAGDTYDAGNTAIFMNSTWKDDAQWFGDYLERFTPAFLFSGNAEAAHASARATADNRLSNGTINDPTKPSLPIPGTPEFENLKQQIITSKLDETLSGSRIVDKTSMYNIEGVYHFGDKIEFADIMIGVNYRIYNINSEGTIFFDEPGNPIRVKQFGSFIQVNKKVAGDQLRFTGSARFDKSDNFDGRITPRFSVVYQPVAEKHHYFRGSVQTAFRFPAIQDQWTDLDVGVFRVIGGVKAIHNKFNFDENPVYRLRGPNPIVDRPDTLSGVFTIPVFKPERVTAFEGGYKGLFNDKLLVDTYVYVNTFNGFINFINIAQNPYQANEQLYRTSISSDQPVTAYGWAFGADWLMDKGYVLKGGIAYNDIEKLDETSAQAEFNTPRYRINLGFSNRNILDNLGFALNWRWQQSFLWESAAGTGTIPSYNSLDAQVSYKFKNLKSVIKLGGNNILNKYYQTGFANPNIGGLYYLSWSFDELLN